MKRIFAVIFLFFFASTSYAVVSNIHAVYKNGQVFVTWTNLSASGVKYYLYKSSTPITNGVQLSSAQNLGYVVDSSGINKRLTKILSLTIPIGLRIDSAGNYLTAATGLFVATTTANGIFYYAIATKTGTVIDTTIIVGSNSLSVTDSVTETLADPQPVWQQSYIHDSAAVQIYVQFVTGITSATYPLMTNAGSFPFNFSIYKSNNLVSPLVVKLHAGDGNFIQSATNEIVTYQNESRLSLDDWVPNSDVNTYWFGYHENYNIYSNNNPVHASGLVRAYTIHRVIFTIDWVSKHFNIDTNRIYLAGISMGAIGARTLAFLYPEKFAAVVMNVPKFNFYSLPELNLITDVKSPSSGINLTGYQARCIDYLLKEDINLSHPFIIAANGKNDLVVGWSEKPMFYDSANVNLLGGAFYWDLKTHNGVGHNWKTNFSPNFFRFRNNCSYPAFSNCTENGNPGNGSPTDGDSVGTINGRIGWADSIVDSVNRYSIILKTMNLTNQNISGLFPELDSSVADVTLRRIQHFNPASGSTIYWINKKTGGQIIQHGCFVYNGGLITVSSIKIFKESDTLIFSLAPLYSTDTQISICAGSAFVLPWGLTVTVAGEYNHIYQTAAGCDSVVKYFVVVHPVFNHSTNENICQGSVYVLPWGDSAAIAGTYSHTYASVTGCDSVVSVNLNVFPVYYFMQNQTICDGSNYQLPWGITVLSTGIYTHHYSTVTACDSVVTFNLIVNPQYNFNFINSICAGDSLQLPWGEMATVAGNYNHVYSTQSGCDSVLNYELTVNAICSNTQQINLCNQNEYVLPWGDSVTVTGSYNHIYNSINGCDSTVTIHVHFNMPSDTLLHENFCDGSAIVLPWGETTDSAGIYNHTFYSITGCDSLVSIYLSANPVYNFNYDTSIQFNSVYNFSWGGSTDTSGVFSHLFISSGGCDSLVTVTVLVLPDGVNENSVQSGFSFTAFPNPVAEDVTLLFSKKLEGRFIISDLSGRQIIESAVNNRQSISMNLQSLANGLYMVSVFDSQQWLGTAKIIVVH